MHLSRTSSLEDMNPYRREFELVHDLVERCLVAVSVNYVDTTNT